MEIQKGSKRTAFCCFVLLYSFTKVVNVYPWFKAMKNYGLCICSSGHVGAGCQNCTLGLSCNPNGSPDGDALARLLACQALGTIQAATRHCSQALSSHGSIAFHKNVNFCQMFC